MQFLTVRELSKSPKEALAKLTGENKAILTNNGKPQALILKIDENNFEKTLSMVQKLEFMQNLTEMRLISILSYGHPAVITDLVIDGRVLLFYSDPYRLRKNSVSFHAV